MENQNKSSGFLEKIKKHYGWIILITLFVILASFIYTFLIATPIYEASSELLITTEPAETEEEVVENQPSTMATYSYFLTSDVSLEPVIEALDLDTTPVALREQIVAEQVENTEIIRIRVQNENPYQASEIANAIAGNFEEGLVETTTTETVQILTAAIPLNDPIRPDIFFNLVLGILSGLFISLVLAALFSGEDDSQVLSPEMVEEVTGVKNIGNISSFTEEDKGRPNLNEDEAEEIAQDAEENLSRMDRHQS